MKTGMAMRLSLFGLVGQVFSAPIFWTDGQQFLSGDNEVLEWTSGGALKVRKEFKTAEIIPTVVDDFIPSVLLDVSWSKKHGADLGNTVKVKKVQDEPTISLSGHISGASSSESCANALKSNMTYSITLTDPDAPSRDDPKWSEMCHWIATGASVSSSSMPSSACSITLSSSDLKEVMPYKPPGPPPKTGKHRYVFLVWAPKNGTSEPLHLSKPKNKKQ